MKPYKVLLADDHVMVRQAIRTFIEKIDGVQICGEVSDGRELLNHLNTSTPDLPFEFILRKSPPANTP